MLDLLATVVGLVRDLVRPRVSLAAENVLLRHQLAILERRIARIKTRPAERLGLALFTSLVPDWRKLLRVVQPATLLHWHRRGFRAYWAWRSRRRGLVPANKLSPVLHALVLRLARENPLWGTKRIAGELAKLGLRVSRRTVQRIVRALGPRPSSRRGQTWRTFLANHLAETWAVDLFTVTTLGFRQLHGIVFLKLDTREIVHAAATEHPTQAWTRQQLREATPWGIGPRFLIRDRDSKLGAGFDAVAAACGTEVLLTPPRQPQANPHVERLIGSIRRECLDHVFVLGERDLARHLREYVTFHNTARPHQGLDQAIPCEARGRRRPRPARPPDAGLVVVGRPVLGGLHHDYRVVA